MVKITKNEQEVWVDFSQHIFADKTYLSTCSSNYGWLVSNYFVLPYYIDNIFIFKRLIFTTAPISLKRQNDGVLPLQTFVDEATNVVAKSKICDFISKPQSNAVFAVAPRGSVSCPWGTYERLISYPDDELLKSFHVKHRNVIKKAIKDGAEVRDIVDLSVLQGNIRDTLRRQGLPYFPSMDFIETLFSNNRGRVLALGVYYHDELQGVALIPFDSQKGYYLYGGSIPTPHGGALNLLQYVIMQRLRDLGVTRYDFVGARIHVEQGSKYEGIQRFKSRFGAELKQGLAFRVVFSPFKYWLYSAMIKTYFAVKWQRYVDPVDQLRQSGLE